MGAARKGAADTSTGSLSSAEAAYSTGRLNAVDLLDGEVMLFDVQTAAARATADFAIATAQLERAVAVPLARQQELEDHDE